MLPVDEGLIHAWLEGQLPDAEAQRVADLVATDPAWQAAAAEARGLIAGTSRTLGALDFVPAIARDRAVPVPRRSRWQAPWLRAAAAVALVGGTATAVWQNLPGGPGAALAPSPESARIEPQSNAAPPTQAVPDRETARAAPPPPASAGAGGRMADAAQSSDTIARQAKTIVADTAVAIANEAGRMRAEIAERRRSDADTLRGGATVGRAVAAAPPVPLVEQGSIGARPNLSSRTVDARVAGCWARIDSTGTIVSFAGPAQDLALEASGIVSMRFIGPVVTDVIVPVDSAQSGRQSAGRGGGRGRGAGVGSGSGSGSGVASGAAAAASSRALLPDRASPPTIGPLNATTRMLPDSSYVAEFVDALGRSEMTFTVAGDTLRGTMRRSAGDVRYPATELRAVRVVCPR
jgi:hypothetical protein